MTMALTTAMLITITIAIAGVMSMVKEMGGNTDGSDKGNSNSDVMHNDYVSDK